MTSFLCHFFQSFIWHALQTRSILLISLIFVYLMQILFCVCIPLKSLKPQNFLESVGDYLSDICYLACRHKVKLESAFINAALACEIMEGLASSLFPDMKVQRIALPMVAKAEMMHRLHLK